MSKPLLFSLLGAVVIALIAFYFWFDRSPVPPVESEIYAPVTTAEERGDIARSVIKDIQRARDDIKETQSEPAAVVNEYADAYENAKQFQADGQFADAQLLYFFAARGNYAPAAFDLASMYDPLHFSSENGLMKKHNASQAFKWYKVAHDNGNETAPARLEELKTWVENAASDGDIEAEQLLMRWE